MEGGGGVTQSGCDKLEGMTTILIGMELWDVEKVMVSRLEAPGGDIGFKEINNVERGTFIRAAKVMVKIL